MEIIAGKSIVLPLAAFSVIPNKKLELNLKTGIIFYLSPNFG